MPVAAADDWSVTRACNGRSRYCLSGKVLYYTGYQDLHSLLSLPLPVAYLALEPGYVDRRSACAYLRKPKKVVNLDSNKTTGILRDTIPAARVPHGSTIEGSLMSSDSCNHIHDHTDPIYG